MASSVDTLAARLKERFGDALRYCAVTHGEVTVEVAADRLTEVATALRDEHDFAFEMLVDLCGVDYSTYGQVEWATDESSSSGFSRGRSSARDTTVWQPRNRFAVVYHLLSVTNNQRLRVRVFLGDDDLPMVDTVTGIWNSANWFEREAFDLFGIVFEGHPDLRRLLTDYGFIGHPFRKDFPLIGNVEMRYDEEQGRVVYEPVSIEERVLVPRVIRHDSRYQSQGEGAADA
jgi:NADH-quinone oxidoreductase subunit C